MVLVGDAGVGKSNIYERYTNNNFTPSPKPTVGTDFSVSQIQFGDDDVVSLHLWDTAGQERYNALTQRM